MKLNLRHAVQQLAPIAPPCFQSRLQWLEFLHASAQAACKGEPSPLIFEPGKPVRFNPSMNFCVDCDDAYRAKHLDAGTCRPAWLLDQPQSAKPEFACTN